MITSIKKRALHRSKILIGQLRGVEKMIEDEKYCVDIMTQSLAIQQSLKSLNKLLLENHLKTHVSHQLSKSSKNKDESIEELLKIYSLSNEKA